MNQKDDDLAHAVDGIKRSKTVGIWLYFCNSPPKRVSDADIRILYGKNAVISRKATFTFVHLDNPSPEVVRRRRREFDPATFFCGDCPLCELMKESDVIVFDESVIEGEDA